MSTTLIKPIPNYIQNHFFKNFIELCNSGKYLLEFNHFISQEMICDNKNIIFRMRFNCGKFSYFWRCL